MTLESTLADAWPVVLDPTQYARAEAAGLLGRLGPMQFEAVIVDGPRFRPAQHCEDQRGAEVAFLFPAEDADGEVVDVVAWWPETGKTLTMLGEIGTLGLSRLTETWLEPPCVHETVLEWARADARGLCVLDPKLAAAELAGFTIAASDAKAGLRIRNRLAPFAARLPHIIVPRARKAA